MNANESRAVIKNYLYSLSYQLLTLILPLVTSPYLTRVLGKDNLGVFGYIQSITSYFVLFGCIGISLYGQREIAFVKKDPYRRTRTFYELCILRAFTLLFSAAVLYVAVIRRSEFPLLYGLFAIELVTAAFDVSWFYQGMDNFRLQTIRNYAVKILYVILVFLFVKNENDLQTYMICYVTVNLLGNLSIWLGIKKYLVPVGFHTLTFWRHLGPTVLLFLPQIATSVYTQLDKTMIGLITDYSQVAIYDYSEKIVKLSLTVITSLNLVMLSRVTGMQAQGESKKAINAIRDSFRFSACLAIPIMFGLIAVTPMFVPWFYGDGWEGCIPVMIVLSPIVLFIGLSGVFGVQYLLPAKRMKAYTGSILTGTFSNLALNLLLIPRFQAVGAAISTVIAEFLVLLVQMILLRKEFGFSLILQTYKYWIAGAVMGVAVYFAGSWMQRRMGGTLLQVLIGAALYSALLWILRDSFFLGLIQMVKDRLNGTGGEENH